MFSDIATSPYIPRGDPPLFETDPNYNNKEEYVVTSTVDFFKVYRGMSLPHTACLLEESRLTNHNDKRKSNAQKKASVI